MNEIEKELKRQENFLKLNLPIFTDQTQIDNTRNKIIETAIKLKGVKFAHRGRTRFGIDCLGLDWISYRRSGITLPDGDGRVYEANWFMFCEEERYLEQILKYFKWVEIHQKKNKPTLSNIKKGDIPLFRCFNNKITHCGLFIYNDNDIFIHAFSGSKVKPDSLSQKWFYHRYVGFVRYRGFMGKGE